MTTRSELLRRKLLLQAEIVADDRLPQSVQERALVRLSQTMFEIARPSFDGPKLSEALRGACMVEPDVGSSAVYIAAVNRLQVFGEFDLARLSALYFVGAPKVIKGKKS